MPRCGVAHHLIRTIRQFRSSSTDQCYYPRRLEADMLRHPVVVALAAIGTLALCLSCTAGRRDDVPPRAKPVVTSITNTYFEGPPASPHDMALAADAVVVGRVLDGRSQDGGFRRPSEPGITTLYRFRVTEVLRQSRGSRIEPGVVTIVRDGGTIDRGDKIEKEEVEDHPQFTTGADYILFLRWHEPYHTWTPRWGPDGTFGVRAGQAHSLGRSDVARKLDGLTIEPFAARLDSQLESKNAVGAAATTRATRLVNAVAVADAAIPDAQDCREYDHVLYSAVAPSALDRISVRQGLGDRERLSSSGAKRQSSPHGTASFVMLEPDTTKPGPWNTTIAITGNQARPLHLVIDVRDHRAGGVRPKWLNEKLLWVQAWRGRIISTDLVLDVETGSVVYQEEADYNSLILPCSMKR